MPCTLTVNEGFIFLAGQLDDTADLTPLRNVNGPVRLNLRHLTAVNSIGLSRMIQFAAVGYLKLEYHECPRIFVDMLNAMPSLLGPKGDPRLVKSLVAPFRCQTCDANREAIVTTAQVQVSGTNIFTPPVPCPHCGAIMRFDDDPTDVFLFLLPRRK